MILSIINETESFISNSAWLYLIRSVNDFTASSCSSVEGKHIIFTLFYTRTRFRILKE